MKRLWRIVLWIVASTLVLLMIIVGAALLFTRTARFNNFLRVQIVQYLAQTYRGTISIGSIEGSVWGSLTLRDIEVRRAGATIASIPQLRLGYRILPALRGDIVLADIDVLNPNLALARDPDGSWNLLSALAARHPSPPSRFNIALRRFTIEQARATVAPAPSTTYRLSEANLVGTGQLGLAGQTFTLDTIAFKLSGPQMPAVRAQGAVHYSEALQVATIEIPGFSVQTERSRIDIKATLRDLSAKNVTATIDLRKLAAADVNSIAPQAGLARDVSGTIHLSGNASGMRAAAALAAGDARLNVNTQADIARSEPTWKMDSLLTEVDLRKLIKGRNSQELPAGTLNATVHANGTGFSVAAIKGTLDARVTGFAARGYRLGELTTTATIDRQTADLKAYLAGPGGHADLRGRVEIAKVPSYNLTLALDHLHPANVVSSRTIPSADLNLTAMVDGSGYQPDTMRTRVQVKISPSTVRAIRIDSGRLDAQLASGTVRIAAASLQARDTHADVSGQLALDSRRAGVLNYKVAVAQASQWMAVVGRRGSGSIELAGQAQGNLHALHTSGAAEVSALRLDSYSVAHARLTYDVSGLGSPLRPAGQAMLTASGLHAGIELKSFQTTVRLIPGATLGADLDMRAEDRASHPITLRAGITYKPGLTMVNLTAMAVGTAKGSWQLTAPAQITQRGSEIAISRLAAANQNQSVRLDGTISQSGGQALALHIENLRLGDLAGLLPGQIKPVGVASSELTVRGTASSPVVAMSATVTELNLPGIPQAAISSQLSYANGRAQAQVSATQDPAHSLTANAAVPFALSWAQGIEAKPTGDMDLRAVSSGLDLAVLNAFRNPQVRDVGGTLTLDVSAHGPLTHPLPRGFIRLSAVRASAPKLNVNVTAGSADVELQPGAVRLVSLTARAGDGTLTGAGVIGLRADGLPGNLDMHVALDRWPAIATHQYNATMAARLNASGPLTAMRAGGRIEVLYGVFRPDLSVTGSAPRPDETITVVHQWSAHPKQPPLPPRSAATGPTFRDLAIDLDIVIDRNTWIKTADFAVEMEGEVHVHKRRGGKPVLDGTINTVHGALVVAGRQFDLTQGRIMFTGGHEINPELMIVAQRRVENYTVSATVGGTAAKPTLTLSSVPDLPQADILSMMMFGKTTNNLSGNQQKDLQNQAISMAGGYAASQIGQAVAQSLGLGELGVTTSSSGVGLGRYVTKNIYVSATQSAANMRDRRAEIQYYFTQHLNLGTSASTNYGNEIKLQWHKDY